MSVGASLLAHVHTSAEALLNSMVVSLLVQSKVIKVSWRMVHKNLVKFTDSFAIHEDALMPVFPLITARLYALAIPLLNTQGHTI